MEEKDYSTQSDKKDIADVDKLREQNIFLDDMRKAVLNILEDVEESEHNLRKKTLELEKFQQAADVSFDHVVITDTDGIILYANTAVEKITGYSKEEVIGKNSGKLWGGRMDKDFYGRMWKTIKIDKKPYSGEIRNKNKNGNEYLASIRVSPILNRKGEVRFFVGVERDITEEREAHIRVIRHAAELQKANELIEEQKERAEGILRFLKSIGDGVIATDMEGKIIFFNEAAEKLTGISGKKALGQYSHDIVRFFEEKNPKNQHKVIQKFLSGGNNFEKTSEKFFLEQKNGSHTSVAFSISFIYDTHKKKKGCMLVFRDVTEERELEKTKDNFLSVAAHQLRTPLSGIRWSLEMLLEGDAGKLPEEAEEIIKNLNENNMRLVALVNDLLNVSRINLGKATEPPKPMNIAETIEAVIKSVHGFADKNKINLIFKKGKGLGVKAMISPEHLFESIENVVSNAIKYTSAEGRVEISLSEKNGALEIAVADTGIGIPKREQEKIFSKFFRAENAVHKEPEGSGLGLNVVKSFIEEAGGKVSFKSAEGKGTVFYINLPVYHNGNSGKKLR